jgi:hypothetical protein
MIVASPTGDPMLRLEKFASEYVSMIVHSPEFADIDLPALSTGGLSALTEPLPCGMLLQNTTRPVIWLGRCTPMHSRTFPYPSFNGLTDDHPEKTTTTRLLAPFTKTSPTKILTGPRQFGRHGLALNTCMGDLMILRSVWIGSSEHGQESMRKEPRLISNGS